MITTITPYNDPRNRASAGGEYDGVVRISINGYYGTGTLLYDGRAVLTAAHLFSNSSTLVANIIFETSTGQQTIVSNHVDIIPSFDAINDNNDLAVIWLSSSAPLSAQRCELYRNSDEIDQTMSMVGYGIPGTGNTGIMTTYSGAPLRLTASNQFDADAATIKNTLGSQISWTPIANTQLIADFDNGNSAQDALGQLINKPGLGLGQNEGMISPGDSGGPAFINGKIAGIAAYTASISQGIIKPDIDTINNSSYGEIGAWQRVSYYQQWIDQTIRSQYINAPTKPEQVQTSVIEGNSGTTVNYFLLQFTGVRTDPAQLLSIDYTTRDGTAIAGQDYLATKGTLVLYANENQAVIPVEIIGDNISEPNEIFYLDVFNPAGGSFGADVIKLTAVRTIVNDDMA